MTHGAYVALLRGINVGCHNKMPMRDLKQMFEQAGGVNVETFIQSGNVIFEADTKTAAALRKAVASAIERHAGFVAPVVLRSAERMRAIVDGNPYLADAEVDQLYVMSLVDIPAAAAVAALDRTRAHPDKFTVRGAEIYMRLVGGMARTKLTNAWFDHALRTVSTARNWRTITKLEEMVRARASSI
jgi:uncharacterized protein (DUF1697 family)